MFITHKVPTFVRLHSTRRMLLESCGASWWDAMTEELRPHRREVDGWCSIKYKWESARDLHSVCEAGAPV